MSDTRHNHDRTAKQCTIFDEYNSTGPDPNTLTISLLEDCRGDGCSYTTDPTVINQALSDFSGDESVKMEVSEDPTGGGLILTLSGSTEHPVGTSRMHSNRIGCTERDEDGWVWYGRSEFAFNKNGGHG